MVFRVGQADEPLAQRGITHLIEHLAPHSADQPLGHVNGEVGATLTTFHRQGSADEVTAFVHAVCQGLRDLPADRVPAEVQVLHPCASGSSRPRS